MFADCKKLVANLVDEVGRSTPPSAHPRVFADCKKLVANLVDEVGR